MKLKVEIEQEEDGVLVDKIEHAEEAEHKETAYLLGIPGMRESILDGLATSLEETSDEPGW